MAFNPIRALLNSLQDLEFDTAYRLGAALGRLAFSIGFRRKIVSENMRIATNTNGNQRRNLVKRCYERLGTAIFCGFHFPKHKRGHYKLLNPQWTQQLLSKKGGAIFLGMHIGQWEFGGGGLVEHCCNQKFFAYTARMRSSGWASDAINDRRRDYGIEVIEKHEDFNAAAKMVRRLRDGDCLILVGDQGARPDVGKPVRLLGQKTFAHDGYLKIAKMARIPVVPCLAFSPNAKSGAFLFIGRPIHCGRDLDHALKHTVKVFESAMARFPTHYFWHHRRFKHQHQENIPPEPITSFYEMWNTSYQSNR